MIIFQVSILCWRCGMTSQIYRFLWKQKAVSGESGGRLGANLRLCHTIVVPVCYHSQRTMFRFFTKRPQSLFLFVLISTLFINKFPWHIIKYLCLGCLEPATSQSKTVCNHHHHIYQLASPMFIVSCTIQMLHC